ncbi:MAG: polysaccharide deacetylase family protein [Planctomycetaceae bacterium]
MPSLPSRVSRRAFLGGSVAGTMALAAGFGMRERRKNALIAITFDLEMSRHYPKRGMTEWDYQKGNLDSATKNYALEAARIVKKRGGVIHFFCVGRVLEQPDVGWLKELAKAGHPIGNHTYDHVNVLARKPAETQFRFRRSPWLVRGKTAKQVIAENIRLTTLALKERAGITADGFRTPGGFRNGLAGRPDVQKLLLEEEFSWVSSKYPAHDSGRPKQPPTADVYASIVTAQRNAQPSTYPSGLVEIPMSPISDVNAFRSKFWKLPAYLKAVRLAVERAIATGGTYDFLCHPSCMLVEDPKFATVKLICDLVKSAGAKAAIVPLGEFARRAVPATR